jgi:signal transduction histidine kinase
MKLQKAAEAEKKTKNTALLRNKYIKICSTIAAGLFICFLLKDYFTGALFGVKESTSSGKSNSIAMNSESSKASDQKETATMDKGVKADNKSTMASGSTANSATNDSDKTANEKSSQEYSKVIWSIYFILNLVLLANELFRYIQHTNKEVFHYLSILFSILISGILLLLINDLQLSVILYFLFLLRDILIIQNKTDTILRNITLISHICMYILYLAYSAYTRVFTNYIYLYPNHNFNILVVFSNSQLFKTSITYFAMAFFYLVFVLIFNQIRQKAELVNLYVELKDVHQKLKEYTIKTQDLAVEKERNRIAQDIHDSLGHSLTALIIYQDYLEQIIDIDLGKSKDVISKTQNLTRQTLTDLREAVYAIKQEYKASGFISSVKSMLNDLINTNSIHVDFNCTENIDKLPPNIAEALYRTIQEALTN